MSTEYTPGPWTPLNRGYKSHVTDKDMNWNAEIVGPRHAANARLIAAAPDLLAAAQHVAAQLGGGNDFAAWEAAKAALLTAIAKATGEDTDA